MLDDAEAGERVFNFIEKCYVILEPHIRDVAEEDVLRVDERGGVEGELRLRARVADAARADDSVHAAGIGHLCAGGVP